LIRSLDDFLAYAARTTNYERQLFYRADRQTFDLDQLALLANALENPHRALPTVHVAGSKGKGSVVRTLEALLQAHGVATGAFLSPHLTSLLERVRIDGQTVDEAPFCQAADRLARTCSETGHQPTFFEIVFLLAALCQRDAGVKVGLYEVGLGGRLDATNLVLPEVCVISAIDLEHTAQLGNDLASIAREKAGILKPGIPAVLGPASDEATRAILQVAADCDAPTRLLGRDFQLTRQPVAGAFERFDFDSGQLSGHYRSAALGAHQTQNAALALAALELLADGGLLQADPAIAAQALAGLQLPACLELFGTPARLVLDAAHTPRAGQALARTLAEHFPGAPLHLVVAFLQGKSVPGVLQDLLPLARSVRVTAVDSPRARPAEEVIAEIGGDAVVVADPQEALEAALAAAGPGELVVVTGSFYLAGLLRERAQAL